MAVTKGGEEKHEATFRCTSHNRCIFLWLRTTWAALGARGYALGKLRQ